MVFNSSEGGREVKVSGVFVSLGGKGGLDHFTLVFFYTHTLSLSLYEVMALSCSSSINNCSKDTNPFKVTEISPLGP